MKICSDCNEKFPNKNFEVIHAKGNYARSICISCKTQKANRKKSSSPKQYIQHLYTQAKSARRDSGKEWKIKSSHLQECWTQQEGRCALSGVFMTWSKDGGGKKEKNISIDRISPHIGYIPSNVQLVCNRINILKHNLTEDDLYWWCKNIITIKELPK
tara:strand:+ start:431 stop:904 length:474 start_codon:yes stop_codon:yes gene_type:complete